ncbi:MAG: glycosyltransferase, partial [Candidatus Hydrogenedentes bacterium]|nr:glycosyltransferase [Candidatus Hydrogenedentota bacterium]
RLLGGFDEGVVAVGGSYRIANRSKALARMVHEEIELRHARFDSEVDFLGSFNVMYRKDAFLELGGFDESFPAASAEDNDLAYRLQDAGGVLRFVRDARVAHYHPWRLRAYLRTQRQHGYWRMKLYAKHPRRARKGDRYAGIVDLSAPALSLAVMMCIPMLLLSAYGPTETLWLARAGWGLILAYTLLRVPMPSRMAVRTGDVRMLGFVGVVILRDVARALGMLSGAWRFLVMHRSGG